MRPLILIFLFLITNSVYGQRGSTSTSRTDSSSRGSTDSRSSSDSDRQEKTKFDPRNSGSSSTSPSRCTGRDCGSNSRTSSQSSPSRSGTKSSTTRSNSRTGSIGNASNRTQEREGDKLTVEDYHQYCSPGKKLKTVDFSSTKTYRTYLSYCQNLDQLKKGNKAAILKVFKLYPGKIPKDVQKYMCKAGFIGEKPFKQGNSKKAFKEYLSTCKFEKLYKNLIAAKKAKKKKKKISPPEAGGGMGKLSSGSSQMMGGGSAGGVMPVVSCPGAHSLTCSSMWKYISNKVIITNPIDSSKTLKLNHNDTTFGCTQWSEKNCCQTMTSNLLAEMNALSQNIGNQNKGLSATNAKINTSFPVDITPTTTIKHNLANIKKSIGTLKNLKFRNFNNLTGAIKKINIKKNIFVVKSITQFLKQDIGLSAYQIKSVVTHFASIWNSSSGANSMNNFKDQLLNKAFEQVSLLGQKKEIANEVKKNKVQLASSTKNVVQLFEFCNKSIPSNYLMYVEDLHQETINILK